MIDLNLNPSRKELRWFAIGLVVFSALAATMVYHKFQSTKWATIVGCTLAVLGVVGFIFPKFARGVYVPWMLAVYPIGWTVSHILLALIFYLVVTPLGLIMRAFGRDPMQRKFDRDAATYWIAREQHQDPGRYFRQF